MAKLGISTGSSPNDGTGDSLIDGAVKANSNFTEIYTTIGDGTTLAIPVTSVAAGTGINVSGSTGSVTITNTGIANTNNLRTDFLEVSGISTLTGALNANGGVVGNVTGSSSQVTVSDESNDTTCFPLFTTAATGNLPPKSGSNLTFNSSTGSLAATQFVGGGAGITGISTLNIVNYSGGGGGSGVGTDNVRTNSLVVSGVSTSTGGFVGGLTGNVTGNISGTTGSFSGNVSVGGGLTVTGISTFGSILYVGQSSNQYGVIIKRGATDGGEINLTGPNSTDANSTYYSNIRLNKTGSFRYDLEFHSNGYVSGDIGDFVFYRRQTSNQRTERMRLSGETGNLTVTGGGSFVGIVTVGAGTSTNSVNTPALTLSHNNPTVVGTSGTTGQIKQIGSQPYYYDGTTWRALFLSEAPLTVNQADSDWDNTMIRMNFDQANIGAVTNLKDGRTPTTAQIDLVSSPIKYGTKTARFQANNQGINFTQNNSGSTYYPFEGAWTLEGWFYFNSSELPTVTNITNSAILFSNYHPNTGTSNNWRIGYYAGGGGLYNFYWNNRNSSDTGSGGAGNSGTGFLLQQINSSNFADNAWHHIAIVREPGNGSIHFYFDGTESTRTNNDELIDNQISDQTNQSFVVGYYGISGDAGQFEGNIDDIRVSKSARYTANFTPPASALPITGSTTTVYEPADSKVGEISLGGSPAWTGTPGVTASQIAAGQYRATFATAYSNATDYVIQTSMNDYTPATTPVGIGVSRFTTHADFFVRRVSDGANIDTGSLAIDLFKK